MKAPPLTGLPPRGRLVVALSGGRDSVVLLHLLRFGGIARDRLVAAHLDHALRPDSAGDAEWVRGLCRAWGLPLIEARLRAAPPSEGAARQRRWAFLEASRRAAGAVAVVTAHHADDQAETVLHHVARGTGLRGLGGIPAGEEGRVRPLLEVPGATLAAWARVHGLRWREDPSNRDPGFTRNRIRHRILPALEEAVPGARDALLRLARTARREEAALAEATARILAGLRRPAGPGRLAIDAAGLATLGPGLRARVLRRCAREVGGGLDAQGTRTALAFADGAQSGRRIELTGGVVLSRELDHFVVAPGGVGPPVAGAGTGGGAAGSDAGAPWVEIARAGAGRAPVPLPTGPAHLHWGSTPPDGGAGPEWAAALDDRGLPLPLRLRAWRAGDRIRMPYGTKKLKKLLLEARLDRERRSGHPVLEDAAGRIVWVPGIRDAVTPAARGTTLHLWILHDAPR